MGSLGIYLGAELVGLHICGAVVSPVKQFPKVVVRVDTLTQQCVNFSGSSVNTWCVIIILVTGECVVELCCIKLGDLIDTYRKIFGKYRKV